MRSSIIISALVAVFVGFGGSLAVILAAAEAVGADAEQTASWVAVLCLAMAGTTAILSIRHRIPIVTAWSTPGAALLAATSGVTMETAVGAFVLAAVLVLLTAAFKPISVLIEKMPTAIASAMLAGVLFGFVIKVFEHLQATPVLVLPMLVAFAVLRIFSPSWAVVIVLMLGVGLAYFLNIISPIDDLHISGFVWITPQFDPATLIGVGVPLYLVTMASQNLPGFAVLRAAEYRVPSRSILTVTGIASLLSAGFGGHTSNLAAIIASICTGEDAHPDKSKRWLTGPVYAAGYAMLALFGASLVTLFTSLPPALIATIAGIALVGPLVGALAASLETPDLRVAGVTTFVVTASGLSLFGIGAAFWGLVAGLTIFGLEKVLRRS